MKSVITFLALLTIALSASASEKANRELAIEYLKASQFEQIIDASIDAYSRQLLKDATPDVRALYEKMMRDTVGWEATKNEIADLVVSVYTKEELRAYIAFVKTRAGRSFTEKSAAFSDKFSVLLANNLQRFIQNNLVPAHNPEGKPSTLK